MPDQSHPYRTKLCNEIRTEHIGQEVRLAGWVHNIRNLGGITFYELRDNYGLTQLLIEPDSPAHAAFKGIRKEFCISVTGVVQSRGEDNINPELETGQVDLVVSEVEVLGEAQSLPFSVFPETQIPEDLRLTHRYLDLRRDKLHKNILLRLAIIAAFRDKMRALDFYEISTPILTSSSPEGARDFLVPSRVHPGQFYALPQAPQQFKQLLMVAGFDRYFQIAPCFRDEDSRSDRTPGEFYQLDIEMSFVTQEEIFDTVSQVMFGVFTQFTDTSNVTQLPFPIIAYDDAMLRYGSDKPDLRNPLEITDVSELFVESEFRAFAGKTVRSIRVPNLLGQPRSFFDNIDTWVKEQGGAGIGWVVLEEAQKLKGPLAKFIEEKDVAEFVKATGAQERDGLFLYSGTDKRHICKILGALRDHLAESLELLNTDRYEFCWLVDFPLYEPNEETGEVMFGHNPFSMPQGGMEALDAEDPFSIKAYQYDIVCNGIELSSGAIRNHRPDIMYKVFERVGYSKEDVDREFGGIIRSFSVGAPPHGGIAPGIDRIVMLLARESNLREIIPFPMNQNAQDLMMGAPAQVSEKQLKELHIKVEMPPVNKPKPQ